MGAEAFDSEQSSSEEGARTFTKWKRNDPAVQILVSTVRDEFRPSVYIAYANPPFRTH